MILSGPEFNESRDEEFECLVRTCAPCFHRDDCSLGAAFGHKVDDIMRVQPIGEFSRRGLKKKVEGPHNLSAFVGASHS